MGNPRRARASGERERERESFSSVVRFISRFNSITYDDELKETLKGREREKEKEREREREKKRESMKSGALRASTVKAALPTRGSGRASCLSRHHRTTEGAGTAALRPRGGASAALSLRKARHVAVVKTWAKANKAEP